MKSIDPELEALGVWEGWKDNIYPPYWGRLRQYVFSRDGHRCRRCHKKFLGGLKLDCHHIIPRPEGSDNPKNLATVCEPCHDIIHLDGDELDKDVGISLEMEHSTESSPTIVTVSGIDYRMTDGGKWEYAGKLDPMPFPHFRRIEEPRNGSSQFS